MDVCSIEDFQNAFYSLDEEIESEIRTGNEDVMNMTPLIVKAIGGFALLYHELRTSKVTADVDDMVTLPECYKQMIKKVGKKLDMPEDWLNDHSSAGFVMVTAKWERVLWDLKHIELYVLDVQGLMTDKCGWAEKNLSGSIMTDRDDTKDLNDFLGILWRLGIKYDTIDELSEKLREFNFDLNEYPNVKKYIENDLNDDGIVWPDGHI